MSNRSEPRFAIEFSFTVKGHQLWLQSKGMPWEYETRMLAEQELEDLGLTERSYRVVEVGRHDCQYRDNRCRYCGGEI